MALDSNNNNKKDLIKVIINCEDKVMRKKFFVFFTKWVKNLGLTERLKNCELNIKPDLSKPVKLQFTDRKIIIDQISQIFFKDDKVIIILRENEHQLTLLDTLALRDNELKTWLKENVTFEFKKKFHPSNRMNQLFNELFYSFLVDFYLNNPDFWYMYKKPEDMNFSLTINVNWGKNPKIFEILKEHKKRCFKDNFLYPIGISKYSLEALGIKERRKYIFPTYDEKRLYDIAIGQTIHREKQRKKTYVEIDEQIMKVINLKYPLLTKESLEKMPDDILNGIFQDVNLRFLYIHPFDDYEKDFFNKIKLQKNIDK